MMENDNAADTLVRCDLYRRAMEGNVAPLSQ